MKRRAAILISILLPLSLLARDITVKNNLYWKKVNETLVEGKISYTYLSCQPCQNNSLKEQLPSHVVTVSIGNNENIRSVEFRNLKTEVVDDYTFNKNERSFIGTSVPKADFGTGRQRGRNQGFVEFVPLVVRNGRIEKITSFELIIKTGSAPVDRRRTKSAKFASSSVLASGEWYKIAVDHDAVYKLSYKFLEQQGINLNAVDPRTIAIFGSGGGMLPRVNSEARPADLSENAIFISGESDGKFDKSDFILFYGEGPHKWSYTTGEDGFKHQINDFSDTSYYFIRIGGAQGKRIPSLTSSASPVTTVTSFDDHKYHEIDRYNLIKSGDDWFGEIFDIQLSYDFNFSFPNVITGDGGFVNAAVATSCRINSTWTISANGSSMTLDANAASAGYAQPFASTSSGAMSFSPTSNLVKVNVRYNKPGSVSSAKGWLDYIEVNARRRLIMTGIQMKFRDLNSAGNSAVRFELTGAKANTRIWDVTDLYNVQQRNLSISSGRASFVNNATTLREYIAFHDYDSTYSWQGEVNNQNLHAERNHHYIIVSHPRFLPAANRLAAIHEKEGLDVFVTTPQRIYNEFSSGSQDIVAIRDFFRMLYETASSTSTQPKYVLFMGDGSYDNKYRLGGNTNFIPTYQSNNSINPTQSYVADDFYALLDPEEGAWTKSELLDLGIGRMPVQTLDQANKVIDKIERYISPQAMGDWRNVICFVGDDEDRNTHMNDANILARIVDTTAAEYNVEKIYIDAFKQFSTPGGERYPDAQEGIKRQVQRGVLVMNYTGHGGEVGWAHERILTMDEINNWTNKYQQPLFVTATCEFSRWDDPQRAAGGEVVLLNPEGGGIALLTTVRLVYSGGNKQLTTEFYKRIFEPVNGELPRLGDVYREVKNAVLLDNTRSFTLLGDPALRLAYPEYKVVTDSINGQHISSVDTVGALGLVEFKGHVTDNNGQKLTNFNGIVYPTVFDKRYDVETLDNDNVGSFNYDVQNKRLFKGKASVKNGEFSFRFVVPKDIAYNFGNGRVSYYTENQIKDGNGYSSDFIVGGTDKNAPEDNIGPNIELYMNDETFIYGGITDENPVLIARVFDEHGINMAGTGIGHDIQAYLDDKNDEPIVLNDYYSADINSYQSGQVNYPFEGLEPGPHKLTFKVWDVYNNSSEAVIEFVVEEFKDITIDKVLNYPNPFTTNTSFWFEHNQPNTVLDVKIQIFTISGKVVKTIDQVIETPGYNQNTRDPISWDGRDEYGDKIGRGVYIYKLQVRSRRNGTMAEKIEKLVIL